MPQKIRFWPHPILAAAVLALLAGVLLPAGAAAQERERPAAADSLGAEIRWLRVQLDSLRAMVAGLQAAGVAVRAESAGVEGARQPPRAAAAARPDSAAEAALAAIRAAAAAAAGVDTAAPPPPQPRPGQFVSRARNLSALNPELSVNADVFALAASGATRRDNFVAREFELALQSNLDPFSRAKIFVAHHSPGGELVAFPGAEEEEEGEVEIEEGYAEWVNLPAGFGVMVGKFRQRVGTLNRWHAHALPGQQLPLPELVFLGEEGLAQAGASLHWLLPLHGLGTYEVWGELTRGDNETLFGASRRLSALGHLNAFWQLSPASYFEVGLTGVTGSRPGPAFDSEGEDEERVDARLYGVDFNFNWRPPARGLYREATLRGAAYLNRRGLPEGGWSDARGAYFIGEYKFAQQWIAGARFEWVENPEDRAQQTRLFAPTLTWWQSEFVRLRAEYDFLSRPGDDFRQFLIQMTFAMGPHKHETY